MTTDPLSTRRTRLTVTTLVVVSAIVGRQAACGESQAVDTPLDVGSSLELAVDPRWIDSIDGAWLAGNSPGPSRSTWAKHKLSHGCEFSSRKAIPPTTRSPSPPTANPGPRFTAEQAPRTGDTSTSSPPLKSAMCALSATNPTVPARREGKCAWPSWKYTRSEGPFALLVVRIRRPRNNLTPHRQRRPYDAYESPTFPA